MKRDMTTTLTVEWSQSRSGASMLTDWAGPPLPKRIRIMLISHLLRDLDPSAYRLDIQDAP